MGDITYIWTHEGWLCLAVVIDRYFRKVVGRSMGWRMTSSLVCDALKMALWSRRPTKGQLIHHSDRSVQYASWAFRKLLDVQAAWPQRRLLGQRRGGELFQITKV